MTPKEKAKELVDKFLPFVDWNDLLDVCTTRDWAIRNAKQCALITIDEVIQTYHSPMDDEQIQEWQEVKQEINNL